MTAPPQTLPRHIDTLVLSEAAILGGTAALFLITWIRGILNFYIHPRYTPLIVGCAVILLLMAAVRLRHVFTVDATPSRPTWIHVLMAVPLVVGTCVPAQPLGASTLDSRGLEVNSLSTGFGLNRLNQDQRTWDLLEWSTAITVRGEALDGQPINALGFVFHDPKNSDPHQFLVVRYIVTCCAADGTGVGLPVQWANGNDLPADSWVHISGTIGTIGTGATQQTGIIARTVEPTSRPPNPYLYP